MIEHEQELEKLVGEKDALNPLMTRGGVRDPMDGDLGRVSSSPPPLKDRGSPRYATYMTHLNSP